MANHSQLCLCRPYMYPTVAPGAQRDQICLCIVARAAAEFFMMNLQVAHAPATLATPSVAFQDLPVKVAVRFSIQLRPRRFQPEALHDEGRLFPTRMFLAGGPVASCNNEKGIATGHQDSRLPLALQLRSRHESSPDSSRATSLIPTAGARWPGAQAHGM